MKARLLTTPRGFVEVAELGDEHTPAVVILHGTPGSWRQALPLAEDLALQSRVFLPSRPGYGLTPLKSGRSFEDQADLLLAMLNSAGIEQASIVGISGGGPVALAFASRHGDRAASLVLLCAVAAHLMDIPRAMRLAARAPGVARVGAAVEKRRQRAILADRERLARRIEHDLTPDERALLREDPRMAQDLERFLRSHVDAPLHHRGLVNDITQFTRARGHGPPTGRVTTPTLILHGDADPVVPLEHAKAHHELIAGSRLEIVRGTGHVFLLTHRDATTALVREHVEQAAQT